MVVAALHHDHLALRLPARPQSVGIGRRAATQFAEEAGVREATLWSVRLAVSEALSNVVLHAYEPDERDGHVVIIAESDDRGIHISVGDEGAGLRSRADSPGMGLGLALIADACTELSLDAGRDGGTVVRMTFAR